MGVNGAESGDRGVGGKLPISAISPNVESEEECAKVVMTACLDCCAPDDWKCAGDMGVGGKLPISEVTSALSHESIFSPKVESEDGVKVVITACLDWLLGSLCTGRGSPLLCARDGMKTSAKRTKAHKIMNHLSISTSTAANPVSLHSLVGTCSTSNQLAWIWE